LSPGPEATRFRPKTARRTELGFNLRRAKAHSDNPYMRRLLAPLAICALLFAVACDMTPPPRADGRTDVVDVHLDDKEMAAAIDKAQGSLKQFLAHYEKPEPGMNAFLVKKRFSSPDGDLDSMWVEVEDYKGGIFYGVLINSPVKDVGAKEGDKVQVRKGEVIDWSIIQGEKELGAYTDELLRKRSEGT
jgi:uncharacterized protein YegJ (DUF2314 family)